jgi:hypothetical protein
MPARVRVLMVDTAVVVMVALLAARVTDFALPLTEVQQEVQT